MSNECRAHVRPEPIEAAEPHPDTLIGRDVHEIERKARLKAWLTVEDMVSLATTNHVIDTYLQSVREQTR